MSTKHLISISQCSSFYHVEGSFIENLASLGIIQVKVVNEEAFLHHEELGELEKALRLHQELEINLEGIGAIHHLLQRMKDLQNEVKTLKNKMRLYEEE